MSADRIIEAARLIVDGRMSARGVRLPPECQPRDEADAYAVQEELHRQFAETSGAGKRIGWKIGCTTPVMRKLLGIDAPAYGGVTEFGLNESQAFYWTGTFARPGVECEIAIRLASDTVPAAAPYTRETIARHVGACMAAMEVVDNRYGDFKATPVPVMIADDFFQASCVLGPDVTDWHKHDLEAISGRILFNGRDMGSGTGAEVMGHPFEALAWLANRLAKDGRKLAAGEFVLTGSFVPVQWITEFPTEAVVEIEGLGSVSARFA